MGRARRELKLADYVAIAISPVLIMTLVGSLVFFLLDVVYRGDHATRIQWVLVCFVGGMVLVARIGIEQGVEQAQIYGAALLGVALLFSFRFLDAFAVAAGLLCLIAFCAWKLTWDCTLVDDSEDASGEGLLRATGLDREAGGATPANTADTNDTPRAEPALRSLVTESPAEPARPIATQEEFAGVRAPVPKVLVSGRGLAEEAERKAERAEQAEKRRRKQHPRAHAPGVWVVYFSLAALPLFGLGQLLIPAAQGGRRSYTFGLLVLYVASGLGLLLTTSFLGLRRYLRQRGVTMPATVTRTWLFLGLFMAVLVLGGATLLPRPSGDYTLNDLIDRLDKQVDSSQFAVLGGDAGQDPGGSSVIRPGNPPEAPPQPDRQANQGDPGRGGKNEDASPDRPGDQPGQQPGGNANGQQPGNRPGTAPKQPGQGDSSGENSGTGESQLNDGTSGEPGAQPQDPANPSSEDQSPTGDPGRSPEGSHDSPQARPENTGKTPAGAATKNQPGTPKQQPPPGQAGGNGPGANPARQQPPAAQNQPAADTRVKPPEGGREAQPPQPPGAVQSALSNLTQSLSSWGGPLKWIIYVILGMVGLYFLILHARGVVEFLRRLWDTFLGLFGAASGSEPQAKEEEADAGPRRYADFVNPFTNGTARRMKLPQLLDYSFQALEAWGREKGVPIRVGQTPLEFAQLVAGRVPAIESEVTRAAQLYTQVAYAKRIPSGDNLEVLEKLWRRLDDTLRR